MTVLLVVLASLLFVLAAATAIGALTAVRMIRSLTRGFDASVRDAVATALAEDREREMAEARAFWAEQEARAAEDAVSPEDEAGLEGLLEGADLVLLPAPRGYVDDEGTMDPEFADALRSALEDLISETDPARGGHGGTAGAGGGSTGGSSGSSTGGGSAPTATGSTAIPRPSRPHHPSVPGFVPQPVATPEWTDLRLLELVDVGIVLRDVRPGPMGTLDVYVFEDETTLCIAPGDRAAGGRIIEAITEGAEVTLLGSSRLPGGHALTFGLGDDETVYILADRVVASL
ncbi:hypothetical protein GXW83_04240 [Streptacidiphilus sp. PB12-B1b]|uniref:hypothetical protein n=1 Tax=Streptacidiphilus sp. PB12-B1b TaxID=2705012 RepID=UPI0015FE5A0B|nr:hypothetical protein [Streptacidiphilus sp. PB12-B1b]QMU75085.1 hypothetical protein GXW83_04240 [Streptacidiphilus sp. PB12-B1b]